MNIVRSEVMGFCSGVRTAVRKVYDAVDLGRLTGRPVYTIGPLIHNEEFLKRLKEDMGVSVIHTPEDEPPGIAVIRAHGIPRAEREAFSSSGFELIDGTCRRVTRSQELVRRYAGEGRQILIAGNPLHGEVQAIAGEIPEGSRFQVIESPQQLPDGIRTELPTLLISQTTFSAEQYRDVSKILLDLFTVSGSDLEVVDSICPATRLRQDALRELIDRVEAVVVIGGMQSANTKQLHLLAADAGKPAWHVSGTGDLMEDIFRFTTVGVTAGASTPEWLIDDVIRKLSQPALSEQQGNN